MNAANCFAKGSTIREDTTLKMTLAWAICVSLLAGEECS